MRIEVVFRTWKSHVKVDEVHQVSECQLRILLKTKLLVIAAASNLYRRFESILWREYRCRLSLLKFMNYMAASMARLNRELCPLSEDALESSTLVKALARYCCYDKRKKRRHFAATREFLA